MIVPSWITALSPSVQNRAPRSTVWTWSQVTVLPDTSTLEITTAFLAAAVAILDPTTVSIKLDVGLFFEYRDWLVANVGLEQRDFFIVSELNVDPDTVERQRQLVAEWAAQR